MEKQISINTEINGRCFQFTHVQIDHMIHAFQIASSVYQKEFKNICDNFPHEPQERKMYWYNKSNMFYDLAEDLKAGKFDI